MERTTVATRSWDALGTRHKRFLMKWVRQRCQTAPGKVAAIASFKPGWASDVMRATPERPRAFNPRRKSSHPAPSSDVTTSTPRTSRCPSALTPMAVSVATFTILPPSRLFWTRASSQR